ncbi:hypothetical protein NDU88_003450 [Pleurodeles waltl]|uniref:Uncharacterized protein n=1 Tax=Pleurodeles waltl TaxID=8319 RepID=A0AAV7TNN0_PLEWA|nr:hypothetical protein NDU88_003450 [Pleurodeles waltl]
MPGGPPPRGEERPKGFLRPGEGPKESCAAPAVCGGRPRDSIGAAERHGRRPGPRAGPLSGSLLSLTPGGPGPWRAWFGPRELWDRGGGCDPRLHSRFGYGGRPCTRKEKEKGKALDWGRTEGGGSPRKHPCHALYAARTDAQSWASGLAAEKKTERGWEKGPRQAPRSGKHSAARAGDAAEARGLT